MEQRDHRLNDGVAGLLRRVWSQGGKLTLEGDVLRVSAPFPLPDELMDRLRARKPELIEALRAIDTPPRLLWRFRPNEAEEWQYMITPGVFSSDDALSCAAGAFGQPSEFAPLSRNA